MLIPIIGVIILTALAFTVEALGMQITDEVNKEYEGNR